MGKNDLNWKLIAEGSFHSLRTFFNEIGQSTPHRERTGDPSIPTPQIGKKLYRSSDGLIEVHVLEASEDPMALLQHVRDHWALLRDKGLADAQPVKIFSSYDDPQSVVYVFRWKTAESRTMASTDLDVRKRVDAIRSISYSRERLPIMNEVYQGFEQKTFPKRGGIELLRGKCTCRVKLDGVPDEFELDGQNGFVIMHRGPRLTQGNSRLMPVTIVAHGADSPASAIGLAAMREAGLTRAVPLGGMQGVASRRFVSGSTGPTIRVEQNTELPQFGIIRAQGPESDFPATAMWVVHWRIHTPLGTVITDPNVPLVFGPTTVQHYPPVGTEFKSATGPVDIYLQDTNNVVGKLTPGELTAFDIVVTMDDEIPSAMDIPTAYHVDMFNKIVADPNQAISLDGFVNDYRVPATVLKDE